MFRLKTLLSQIDALAARLFSDANTRAGYTYVSKNEAPVTESCIPSRRRRTRRQLASGSGEVLRSTWF